MYWRSQLFTVSSVVSHFALIAKMHLAFLKVEIELLKLHELVLFRSSFSTSTCSGFDKSILLLVEIYRLILIYKRWLLWTRLLTDLKHNVITGSSGTYRDLYFCRTTYFRRWSLICLCRNRHSRIRSHRTRRDSFSPNRRWQPSSSRYLKTTWLEAQDNMSIL